METKSFILVVGSMKQFCLTCDKVFYPTDNNYIGYPYSYGQWSAEQNRFVWASNPTHNRVFHSRSCMESFLCKHTDILTPIYKQIKEREGNNARTRENQTELAEAPSA